MHGLGTIIALNDRKQAEYDALAKKDAEIKRLRAANRILKRQLAKAEEHDVLGCDDPTCDNADCMIEMAQEWAE